MIFGDEPVARLMKRDIFDAEGYIVYIGLFSCPRMSASACLYEPVSGYILNLVLA